MKRFICGLMLVVAALFVQVDDAAAATVLKKTTNLISNPNVEKDMGVYFQVGGNAKYIKHTKYLQPGMTQVSDVGLTRAATRITDFAYRCPGYYTTRIYSDTKGMNLIGYIQVYVSTADINNGTCDTVTPMPATPTPPPPPQPIHPIPTVQVQVEKVESQPKVAFTAVTQPTQVDYCVANAAVAGEENYEWLRLGDKCCPNEPGWAFINNECIGGLSDDEVDQSYCNNQVYNQTTKKCETSTLSYNGNAGDYPLDMYDSTYMNIEETEDFSLFSQPEIDDYPGEPTEPIEPTDPSPPSSGGGGSGDKPSCFCEEMEDWGYLCCIFECPGWDDYLSFLSDDLVGRATPPDPPEWDVPDIPNIFDVLNDVDKRNPAKPTGENAPGLDDASFTANDIKMEAEEIPFREDPTGGFDIVNPLDTLPEDGSTAPRPQEELETLPYPGGSGKNISGGSTPSPSGSGGGAQSSAVNYPSAPGGQAKTSETGGTAAYPIP